MLKSTNVEENTGFHAVRRTFSSSESYFVLLSARNTSVGLKLLIELRKASNHSLLIRNYYTDDMLSKMAQKYCKVLYPIL